MEDSNRPISPPALKRRRIESPPPSTQHSDLPQTIDSSLSSREPTFISSPFHLSNVQGIASENNVDTISLKDILGDPLIIECWQFNYCFDVDFLMAAFDDDVRSTVRVSLVHGFWKQESASRMAIEEAATRYANVKVITAYMPEPFGTHHTKMMVLFKNDDTAQVIITTANILPADWTTLTQAIWRSPSLPLSTSSPESAAIHNNASSPIGSGLRFKHDLISYLKAYGTKRLGSLIDQLDRYDFSAVKACLIGSVPTKQHLNRSKSRRETVWGWQALKETLGKIPSTPGPSIQKPTIVVQVSSIASLGATETWLDNLYSALSLSSSDQASRPDLKIVWPSSEEVRRSMAGYSSGGSIHLKLDKPAHQRQFDYMKSRFCYWSGDGDECRTKDQSNQLREAGRRKAAPHIKTYIRFSDSDMTKIDWAMITSANLSKQAWGELENKNGEVRICSYELGVLVWPDLFSDSTSVAEDRREATMVPTFKKDTPTANDDSSGTGITVGVRLPYDLPLAPYKDGETPWCTTMTHSIPDWMGRTWQL